MGYIPTHLYLVTGDKKFEADYRREEKFSAIGLAVTSIVSFGILIGTLIYCLIVI